MSMIIVVGKGAGGEEFMDLGQATVEVTAGKTVHVTIHLRIP